MATFLALCLGILLPAAAMPVHICLFQCSEPTEDCRSSCTGCDQECCVDLEILPEALLPGGNFETPAFVGYAIPPVMAELPDIPERIEPSPRFAQPRTGIGPPTARLAVLNVWRL